MRRSLRILLVPQAIAVPAMALLPLGHLPVAMAIMVLVVE
jgi:hypothetical protein